MTDLALKLSSPGQLVARVLPYIPGSILNGTGIDVTQSGANYTIAWDAATSGFQSAPFIATGSSSPRTLADRFGDMINVKDFGAQGNNAVDDTAAIQSAIASVSSENGGTIFFPPGIYRISSTLLITHANVRLIGSGGDVSHNAGSNVTPSTTLLWIGSAGGTIVKFGTVHSNTTSVITGCSLQDVCLDGHASAATGLQIDTMQDGEWKFIFIKDVTDNCFLLSSGVAGTDTGTGETSSNQGHIFERCHFRVIDTAGVQSANGFTLSGSSNGNVSFNKFSFCWGVHWNGAGFLLKNADSNTFEGCRSFTAGAGTGNNFDCWAPGADGTGTNGGDDNCFIGCGWQSFKIRGTEQAGSTGPSKHNCILSQDFTNNAPTPAIGTGVIVYGVWIDFTASATLTPGSGAFTSVTVNTARYRNDSKTVYYYIRFTITTNGTAGTDIRINLPIAAKTVAGVMNGVDLATGDWLGGYVDGTNGRVLLRNYAGAYSFINGSNVVIEGFYEAA